MKKLTIVLLAGMLMVAGCKDRKSDKMSQAEALREEARAEFLDSALQQVQQELAQTDSLLEEMKRLHDKLQGDIKTKPYSKQLEYDLTETRRLRDSLQVEFDTQCAKIKYLHRKQKQP